jgi:hypothetical protein
MPGAAKFKMDKRWKRLEKQLGPGVVQPTLRKHLRRASMFIGKKGEALIREEIASGKFDPNAPLTVALKGGRNEPLIGDRPGAPFFKAITSKVVDDITVFVGILQQNKEYELAVMLHEGKVIGVTAKMRGMFFVLWRKETDPSIVLSDRAQELWDKMPGGWKPLKESTKAIVIPGRPFIRQVWNKGEMQDMAKKFWDQAMAAAMKELSSQ